MRSGKEKGCCRPGLRCIGCIVQRLSKALSSHTDLRCDSRNCGKYALCLPILYVSLLPVLPISHSHKQHNLLLRPPDLLPAQLKHKNTCWSPSVWMAEFSSGKPDIAQLWPLQKHSQGLMERDSPAERTDQKDIDKFTHTQNTTENHMQLRCNSPMLKLRSWKTFGSLGARFTPTGAGTPVTLCISVGCNVQAGLTLGGGSGYTVVIIANFTK